MLKLIIGCPILLTKVFPVSEFIPISTFSVVHNREQHYFKISYTKSVKIPAELNQILYS